jgi:hypothetical protein
MDTTAVAAFWSRSAIQRLAVNQYNFSSCCSSVEMQLQVLCRAYLRMAAGQGGNEPGKLSDVLQYLVLYIYGLIKTPLLSPI